MEIKVEGLDNSLPSKCYIGIRAGGVQKQALYDAKTAYRFPEVKRNSKIDIFRRIGTCDLAWSCDGHESRVCTALDPNKTDTGMRMRVSMTRLSAAPKSSKVAVQSGAAAAAAAAAAKGPANNAKAEAAAKSAKYISEHGVEDILTAAMRALLKQLPDDAPSFLCDFIATNYGSGKGQNCPAGFFASTATTLGQSMGSAGGQSVQEIRREKEDAVKAPFLVASATQAEQSGQTTADADDPELAQAALKIQAVQRGKRERLSVQQIRREREEQAQVEGVAAAAIGAATFNPIAAAGLAMTAAAVSKGQFFATAPGLAAAALAAARSRHPSAVGLIKAAAHAASAAPASEGPAAAEPSCPTSADADDAELTQAAVRIQAMQRGKKERQSVQQIRRGNEEVVEAPRPSKQAQGLANAAISAATFNPIAAAGLAVTAAAVSKGSFSIAASGLAAAALAVAKAGHPSAVGLIKAGAYAAGFATDSTAASGLAVAARAAARAGHPSAVGLIKAAAAAASDSEDPRVQALAAAAIGAASFNPIAAAGLATSAVAVTQAPGLTPVVFGAGVGMAPGSAPVAFSAGADDPELVHAAVKIQAVQRGKKERKSVQEVRREKEETVKVATATL